MMTSDGRWVEILSDSRLETIHRYGRSTGLIGEESLEQHVTFARSLTATLPEFSGRVVDFGAGAGLVGLSLQLFWPSAEVWWLDRRSKSIRSIKWALSQFPELDASRALLADLKDVGRRVEPPPMDIAVGRSVGDRSVVLPLASNLLRPGGILAVASRSDANEHRALDFAGLFPVDLGLGIDAWRVASPSS
jgi:16S rRNA G527 N7-methylase RsmG